LPVFKSKRIGPLLAWSSPARSPFYYLRIGRHSLSFKCWSVSWPSCLDGMSPLNLAAN